ncbi:hypothetical protein ACH5RR_004938 [Cinchona calisaya]|uniref:Peptidase A1 domain-containing protein n=1 Tax=Cinchona calisaya TaxID=153742 RepID=A0ABD3AYZ5_9GENT
MALRCGTTLYLCFLLLLLFSSPSTAKTSFPPKALILPVTKDSSTGQYTTHIYQRTPLVLVKLTVDLGGDSLWVDCEEGYVSTSYKNVKCKSAHCVLARPMSCGDNCFSNAASWNCNKNG